MESQKLKPIYSADEIASTVGRLAREISRDYRGQQPILIGVLKGAFVFMADLVRRLEIPAEIEFVTLSSYGKATETTGRVKIIRCLQVPVRGRHVVIVEDIVDSGLTLEFFVKYLLRRKPASIKVCALLDKAARRKVTVPIDYRGLSAPEAFLVGYGLDWNENFRCLPGIYALSPEAIT
ncbi:MAG: hypoxanthine phosphoribosyltransferase [Chloroflexi bacterium]|nr:hypoxanthine phosphoribosyltransferase [Chloroflexota bacterium]